MEKDIDNSSQPTEESPRSVDSDAMIEPPEDNVGDIKDVTYDGKVKKEILEVGEGVKNPKRNYIAKVIYKAYFFDHAKLDSSNGEVVDIPLGDLSYPEGLWKGIEEMRKNEKAKIKIKKKYGFGRQENIDKLRFPKGYEEQGSKNRERLMKKGIIYEVKLLDWIEREDIEADGNFLKIFEQKSEKREWETPSDKDEIKLTIKIYQKEEEALIEEKDLEINMEDQFLTHTIRKVVSSLKRNEKSTTQLIKVEDWFKDGTTFKRVLRKGKGATPDIESTVTLRLRVSVNNKEILNNYNREKNPEDQDDQKQLDEEQKKYLQKDQSLYTVKLDNYRFPSLLNKVIKSMKVNEVCEFKTTKIDKLHNNFTGDLFDQYSSFKEGDQVSFFISLIKFEKSPYFYKLKVTEKLARILHLKSISGQFFKQGNYLKASKIYQKINGYYNFGDATNNYAKEDENDEQFKKANEELQSIKVTSFVNLVVCKYKLKEYESIVNITDQIQEMDPNNKKSLFFRGKAFLEIQEYDQAVKCLTQLCQIDPNNTDARKELERAKQIKKNFLERQHKAFSKMFS